MIERGVPSFWFVGFTGHRNLADPEAVRRLIRGELEWLAANTDGQLVGRCSAAAGGDQLFLEECQALGIPYEVYLPFGEAEFREDFSEEEWLRTERLIRGALRVDATPLLDTRNDTYFTCGIEIVYHCDVLIAVWDDQPARGRGGTGDIVKYARNLRKPMLRVDTGTATVKRKRIPTGGFRDQTVTMLQEVLGTKALNTVPRDQKSIVRIIKWLQLRADQRAVGFAPRVKRLALFFLGLGLAAGAAGFIGSTLQTFGVKETSWFIRGLGLLQLVIFIAIFGFSLAKTQKNRRNRWVAARFLAEYCRALLKTWRLPEQGSPLMRGAVPDFDRLTRSLDFLKQLAHRSSTGSWRENVHLYVHRRIDDQIQYYKRKREGLPVIRQRLRWLMIGISFLAMASAVGMAVLGEIPNTDFGAQVLRPFPGFLVSVITAIFTLIFIFEIDRRIAHNQRMITLLEQSRIELLATVDPATATRIIGETEQALMSEVLDWYFHHRYGK